MSETIEQNETTRQQIPHERVVMPGDVWRKRGPCDWVKVLHVQMPHNPDYDGGIPGCSVKFTNCNGNWQRKSWFIPAKDTASFEARMTEGFRYKA